MKGMMKKIASILIVVVMLAAMLPMNVLAASWDPDDRITITVRVFDESSGNNFVIGEDTCRKGDQYIQSDPYQIPNIEEFAPDNDYGRVTKVVGNWYFPTGDRQVGSIVNWSCNSSTATMTYWVTNWSTGTGSGSGSSGSGSENQGDGNYSMTCKIVYHSNYPTGTNYEQTYNYTIHAGYNIANTGKNVDLKTPADVGFNTPDGYVQGSPTWKDADGKDADKTYFCKNGQTVHLYAQWVKEGGTPAEEVTLTYMNGSETYATQSYFSGDTVTVGTCDAEKTGYTFKGWANTADGAVVYTPGATFEIDGDTILYAVWEKDKDPEVTYTLTYDANGGTGAPAPQTASSADQTHTFIVSDVTPEREGYIFQGWADDAEATDPDYLAGEDLTLDASAPTKTVYAVWKESSSTPDPTEKEDEPSITKDHSTTNIKPGDEITYTLTSNVPSYLLDYVQTPDEPGVASLADLAGAGFYKLTFHDKMPAEITLNKDSITVTIGGRLVDPANYQVFFDDLEDGCTFHVEMDLVKLYNDGVITPEDVEQAAKIVVTYTAILSEDATTGTYTNQAWVDYEDKTSEPDKDDVNLYGISIFKYDQADNKKGLAGAEFALYTDEACTTPATDKDGNPITAISAEDGYAIISALPEGTYYLKETKAPEGYVKSDTPLMIVVPGSAGANNVIAVEFANTPVPHTGGNGTAMYTIVGFSILGAAAVVFMLSRKKQANY